jgi:hypothetical protein
MSYLPYTILMLYSTQSHNISVFGELREVHIIRNPDGTNKGCAFIKYIDRYAYTTIYITSSIH